MELPCTIAMPDLFSMTRPGSTLGTSIVQAMFQVDTRFVEQPVRSSTMMMSK